MWMISGIITKTLASVLTLFFPHHCFLCKRNTSKESLCKECFDSFSKTVDTPAPYIVSIYSFKDPRIKKVVHAIKYFHRKDLIEPFADKLLEAIIEVPNYRLYVLVPIPMPLFRKYVRGYNHTELIAQAISKQLYLPVMNHLLVENKTRKIRRQVTTKSRSERIHNKYNAFVANPEVNGLKIILIDDVTTTGATLHEARRELLHRGAADVIAFTVAH